MQTFTVEITKLFVAGMLKGTSVRECITYPVTSKANTLATLRQHIANKTVRGGYRVVSARLV